MIIFEPALPRPRVPAAPVLASPVDLRAFVAAARSAVSASRSPTPATIIAPAPWIAAADLSVAASGFARAGAFQDLCDLLTPYASDARVLHMPELALLYAEALVEDQRFPDAERFTRRTSTYWSTLLRGELPLASSDTLGNQCPPLSPSGAATPDSGHARLHPTLPTTATRELKAQLAATATEQTDLVTVADWTAMITWCWESAVLRSPEQYLCTPSGIAALLSDPLCLSRVARRPQLREVAEHLVPTMTAMATSEESSKALQDAISAAARRLCRGILNSSAASVADGEDATVVAETEGLLLVLGELADTPPAIPPHVRGLTVAQIASAAIMGRGSTGAAAAAVVDLIRTYATAVLPVVDHSMNAHVLILQLLVLRDGPRSPSAHALVSVALGDPDTDKDGVAASLARTLDEGTISDAELVAGTVFCARRLASPAINEQRVLDVLAQLAAYLAYQMDTSADRARSVRRGEFDTVADAVRVVRPLWHHVACGLLEYFGVAADQQLAMTQQRWATDTLALNLMLDDLDWVLAVLAPGLDSDPAGVAVHLSARVWPTAAAADPAALNAPPGAADAFVFLSVLSVLRAIEVGMDDANAQARNDPMDSELEIKPVLAHYGRRWIASNVRRAAWAALVRDIRRRTYPSDPIAAAALDEIRGRVPFSGQVMARIPVQANTCRFAHAAVFQVLRTLRDEGHTFQTCSHAQMRKVVAEFTLVERHYELVTARIEGSLHDAVQQGVVDVQDAVGSYDCLRVSAVPWIEDRAACSIVLAGANLDRVRQIGLGIQEATVKLEAHLGLVSRFEEDVLDGDTDDATSALPVGNDDGSSSFDGALSEVSFRRDTDHLGGMQCDSTPPQPELASCSVSTIPVFPTTSALMLSPLRTAGLLTVPPRSPSTLSLVSTTTSVPTSTLGTPRVRAASFLSGGTARNATDGTLSLSDWGYSDMTNVQMAQRRRDRLARTAIKRSEQAATAFDDLAIATPDTALGLPAPKVTAAFGAPSPSTPVTARTPPTTGSSGSPAANPFQLGTAFKLPPQKPLPSSPTIGRLHPHSSSPFGTAATTPPAQPSFGAAMASLSLFAPKASQMSTSSKDSSPPPVLFGGVPVANPLLKPETSAVPPVSPGMPVPDGAQAALPDDDVDEAEAESADGKEDWEMQDPSSVDSLNGSAGQLQAAESTDEDEDDAQDAPPSPSPRPTPAAGFSFTGASFRAAAAAPAAPASTQSPFTFTSPPFGQATPPRPARPGSAAASSTSPHPFSFTAPPMPFNASKFTTTVSSTAVVGAESMTPFSLLPTPALATDALPMPATGGAPTFSFSLGATASGGALQPSFASPQKKLPSVADSPVATPRTETAAAPSGSTQDEDGGHDEEEAAAATGGDEAEEAESAFFEPADTSASFESFGFGSEIMLLPVAAPPMTTGSGGSRKKSKSRSRSRSRSRGRQPSSPPPVKETVGSDDLEGAATGPSSVQPPVGLEVELAPHQVPAPRSRSNSPRSLSNSPKPKPAAAAAAVHRDADQLEEEEEEHAHASRHVGFASNVIEQSPPLLPAYASDTAEEAQEDEQEQVDTEDSTTDIYIQGAEESLGDLTLDSMPDDADAAAQVVLGSADGDDANDADPSEGQVEEGSDDAEAAANESLVVVHSRGTSSDTNSTAAQDFDAQLADISDVMQDGPELDEMDQEHSVVLVDASGGEEFNGSAELEPLNVDLCDNVQEQVGEEGEEEEEEEQSTSRPQSRASVVTAVGGAVSPQSPTRYSHAQHRHEPFSSTSPLPNRNVPSPIAAAAPSHPRPISDSPITPMFAMGSSSAEFFEPSASSPGDADLLGAGADDGDDVWGSTSSINFEFADDNVDPIEDVPALGDGDSEVDAFASTYQSSPFAAATVAPLAWAVPPVVRPLSSSGDANKFADVPVLDDQPTEEYEESDPLAAILGDEEEQAEELADVSLPLADTSLLLQADSADQDEPDAKENGDGHEDAPEEDLEHDQFGAYEMVARDVDASSPPSPSLLLPTVGDVVEISSSTPLSGTGSGELVTLEEAEGEEAERHHQHSPSPVTSRPGSPTPRPSSPNSRVGSPTPRPSTSPTPRRSPSPISFAPSLQIAPPATPPRQIMHTRVSSTSPPPSSSSSSAGALTPGRALLSSASPSRKNNSSTKGKGKSKSKGKKTPGRKSHWF
ncbi:hypothetical protein BC828DRAFT_219081 [Blastocladiella britannica]|nr:hypothetical protein BC828DRAFT_219081 [Blastocladiella britannica]